MIIDSDCGKVNWWTGEEVYSVYRETTCKGECKSEWMDYCGGKGESGGYLLLKIEICTHQLNFRRRRRFIWK